MYRDAKKKIILVMVLISVLVFATASVSLAVNDEDQIKANFASAISSFNNTDVNGIMSWFSDNYLDDGRTKTMQRNEFIAKFADPGFTAITYVVNSVVVTGSTATFSFTPSDKGGPQTLIWKREIDNVWRIYGNQQKYGIYANTGRQHGSSGPDSYWVNLNVDDPDNVITSVVVTGSGLSAPLNLVHDGANQNWHQPWDGSYLSWNTRPALPLNYSVTIHDNSGSTVIPVTLSTFIDIFAANVSPAAGQTTSGPLVFSWYPVQGGYFYAVELDSSTGRIWDKYDMTAPYIVYNGPALGNGTYTYNAQVRDKDGNFSMVTTSFTYQTGAGISFPGVIQDASNAAVSGATIELFGAPTVHTSSGADGSFTLAGLPNGSVYSLKMTKAGFVPAYSRNFRHTANVVAVSTYGLNTAAEIASWGVNAGKGVIRGRVADQSNTALNISGAAVSCTSALHPGTCPYTVTYYNGSSFGGASTFGNGKYFVLNVDDGDVVTVTASKTGMSFTPRDFFTHADSVGIGSILGVTAGSISGTVSYSGTQSGNFIIGLFTSPNITPSSTPVYYLTPPAPGAYTFNNVANGTYYVGAILTKADNSNPIKLTDPYGAYGIDFVFDFNPDAVIVNNNATTNINFTLHDGTVQHPNPFFAPPGHGTISGTISYAGSKTGTIYVGFFTTPISCTGPNPDQPVADMILPSLGSYSYPYLPDGTYYVASAISTGGPDSNMKSTDPYGIYNGCGGITPVVISGGSTQSGINISLVDGTALAPNPFYTPTISFAGGVNNSAGSPINGALVEMVGNSSVNTTSGADGSFVLNGLPSGTDFSVMMSKTGYLPTYTNNFNSTSDVTAAAFNSLLTPADVSTWGLNAGKGVISARVADRNNPSVMISGAVVTCASSLHPGPCPYTITYNDGTGFSGASTFGNGRFFVMNVDDGDTVTVNASRAGWSFSPRVFLTHADAVGQGRIQGTSTGSISGTVSYSGGKTGLIYIGVFSSADITPASEPVYSTSIAAPGSYTISGVANGTYYVGAVRTNDMNHVQMTDPFGWHGAPTAVIINSNNAAGINITMTDGTASAPNPLSAAKIMVASVLMKEDFGSGMPASWTTDSWNTGNACAISFPSLFAAPWALADSACGAVGINTLTTGSFSAKDCTAIELSLVSASSWSGGSGKIDISQDNGLTWTTVRNLTAFEAPEWIRQDINGISGASSAKVRFGYTAAGYWAIDNIWISCRPAALKFSSNNQQQAVLVENTGTRDLVIGTAGITGTDAANFAIPTATDGCSGLTLPPGGSCALELKFTSAAGATRNAALNIPSNDPVTPVSTVALRGSTIAIGDVDDSGTMNIVDALFVARHAAGLSVASFDSAVADVNCDGTVNIVDALLIARKAAGLTVAAWCGL